MNNELLWKVSAAELNINNLHNSEHSFDERPVVVENKDELARDYTRSAWPLFSAPSCHRRVPGRTQFHVRDAEGEWFAEPQLTPADGCFLRNQLRDLTLTDGMQIGNLSQMSWRAGLKSETKPSGWWCISGRSSQRALVPFLIKDRGVLKLLWLNAAADLIIFNLLSQSIALFVAGFSWCHGTFIITGVLLGCDGLLANCWRR